jgi:hypothetical protein
LSNGIVVKNLPNSQFHNEMQNQHMSPNPQQKEMHGGWRMGLGQANKLSSWLVWGNFQRWKHIQWTRKTLSKHSMYIHIETWGHQTNFIIILKQFQVFHVTFFLNPHKLMSNPLT